MLTELRQDMHSACKGGDKMAEWSASHDLAKRIWRLLRDAGQTDWVPSCEIARSLRVPVCGVTQAARKFRSLLVLHDDGHNSVTRICIHPNDGGRPSIIFGDRVISGRADPRYER